MKHQLLSVKRRPVTKGIFRRLSAVTYNRHQRAAIASSPADMAVDEGGSWIFRGLIIIFLVHIVAVGLYFIHSRYLEGRFPTGAAKTLEKAKVAIVSAQRVKPRENLPQLSHGEKSYVVRAGDNYTRIAAVENVDEAKLRLVNNHVDIGPGLALKMPPKRIVAVDPPEVTAQREQSVADHSNRGLVEATPVNVVGAPKARPVRLQGGREVSRSVTVGKAGASASRASGAPKVSGRAPVVAVVGGGKSHVVKSGESISRIANRFKVSQVELMRVNHINDARKMKIGTKLVIPKS